MDVGQIPLLGMLRQKLSWLHARQLVISENVANADTPGFQSRDLKPLDFARLVGAAAKSGAAGTLAVTHPKHIVLRGTGNSLFGPVEAADIEASPDGNTVSLEGEMIRIADTQAQFQAATNLYRQAVSLIRTALGGRST